VRRAATLICLSLSVTDAEAQDYDGYFSTLFVAMPDVNPAAGRQAVLELRTRLFAEGFYDFSERIHTRAGMYVDALIAERDSFGAGSLVTDALVRPADFFVEYRAERFDMRAGMSRIVWGRLDEFQPTDVVNAIDLSRFLLEGRSEARLPSAVIRGRVFLPHESTIEGIVMPVFRRGRFDQLDEDTSPFRLAPGGRGAVTERHEPGVSWSNLQGGARLTSTIGRVDWSVSAWRGFETFPTYTLAPFTPDPLALVVPTFIETFPRFTMLGADFETVSGLWGVRGEFAWFDSAAPRSFEGGIGADRRAGDYRVAVNALVSRANDTDVTLVGWAERTFAQETRSARVLAVYGPRDETAFVRAIGAISVRENVWVEGSVGWFTGEAPVSSVSSGIDVLSLLSRRDFLYARLKFHF
jgi:hypothetical protein